MDLVSTGFNASFLSFLVAALPLVTFIVEGTTPEIPLTCQDFCSGHNRQMQSTSQYIRKPKFIQNNKRPSLWIFKTDRTMGWEKGTNFPAGSIIVGRIW